MCLLYWVNRNMTKGVPITYGFATPSMNYPVPFQLPFGISPIQLYNFVYSVLQTSFGASS